MFIWEGRADCERSTLPAGEGTQAIFTVNRLSRGISERLLLIPLKKRRITIEHEDLLFCESNLQSAWWVFDGKAIENHHLRAKSRQSRVFPERLLLFHWKPMIFSLKPMIFYWPWWFFVEKRWITITNLGFQGKKMKNPCPKWAQGKINFLF